jgi:adenine phosphoribosyltransferase
MVRKKGAKYPGKLLEESYELEYGTDTLTLQEGILGHTSRVLIADDLIATGGSMIATKKLVEQTGAIVEGAITIVNLKYLNKSELSNIDISSALEIDK